MIRLSARLQCVADMVTKGGSLVDIGTDHAYIPLYLAERGYKTDITACDIGRGPISRAEENIKKYGMEGQIKTCLSDGLENVGLAPGASIIIAGMGGLLIRDILDREPEKVRRAGELILQPQSEICELRTYLYANGLEIRDEDAVAEDGKYYFVIRAVSSGQTKDCGGRELSEAGKEFGPVLLEKRHPVLGDYIRSRIAAEGDILSHLREQDLSAGAEMRKEQLLDHISLMERTISKYYEMQ